jgi:hypothetical protein
MFKKKEKKHVHTGFLDDMSEEQTAKLSEFRKLITDQNLLPHP